MNSVTVEFRLDGKMKTKSTQPARDAESGLQIMTKIMKFKKKMVKWGVQDDEGL